MKAKSILAAVACITLLTAGAAALAVKRPQFSKSQVPLTAQEALTMKTIVSAYPKVRAITRAFEQKLPADQQKLEKAVEKLRHQKQFQGINFELKSGRKWGGMTIEGVEVQARPGTAFSYSELSFGLHGMQVKVELAAGRSRRGGEIVEFRDAQGKLLGKVDVAHGDYNGGGSRARVEIAAEHPEARKEISPFSGRVEMRMNLGVDGPRANVASIGSPRQPRTDMQWLKMDRALRLPASATRHMVRYKQGLRALWQATFKGE